MGQYFFTTDQIKLNQAVSNIQKNKRSIEVTKPFLPPIKEYNNLLRTVWDNHWLTNQGPLHEELKQKLKEYLGAKELTLFSNGHMALEIALQAFHLDGEVITTPFTFASTTHAIIRNGLKPVFCDIKVNDFNIDEKKIENLISEDTTAILPVHVFGNPCNVYKIEKIAKKYDLKVIYDAAHAFGVNVDGKHIGSFGDVSMFSFHATKVFHTIEGGALVYNNKKMAHIYDLYKNFGISPVDGVSIELPGLNAKMNEFQAAMGLLNLKYIDSVIGSRKGIAELYNEGLKRVDGIKIPDYHKNVKYNYAYYPIIIEDKYPFSRDELYAQLADKNIHAKKYFYPLTVEYNCYKDNYNVNSTPVAKYICDRVLCLPIYQDLDTGVVESIIDMIQKR